MLKRIPFIAARYFVAVAAIAAAASASAADVSKGKAAYAAHCASCHSIEFNGAGPAHRGVLGRKAGSVADYAYSPALKASRVIWTAEALDKWLADPEKFIPGQKMWISVPDAKDRQDIIAYLREESAR